MRKILNFWTGSFTPALARSLMVAALLLGGTAARAEDGVGKTSIALGQSVALTGAGAALAVPFAQGAKLYFDRVNESGGVAGRRIELVTMDDAGDPAATLANTKKLLDQGVLALFGYYGSAQVTAVNGLLKESDVMLFAPMAGADELRGSVFPNVYVMRPGYSEEAAAITRHAETLGARKLVIMHARDSESMAALDSAERTMTSLGANLLLKAPLDAVDKVLAARPESVLVIGDYRAAADAIRALRGKGFRGPVYGFSSTGEGLLAEQLGAVGAGVVVVRVTPKSDLAKSSLVRALQADAAAAKLKPSSYMLEGYIAARTLVEALRKSGKEPTRAKLRKAVEGISDLDLGGFRVSFDGERVGSKLVELSLIDSTGRIRE